MAKETKVVNGKSSHTNNLPSKKSLWITYACWLFGGQLGLHHLYLHRDRQAFIWFMTFGGYFGIGWFFDLFLIPGYVRDANEDPIFIKHFIEQLRTHPKPPYSSLRFVGQVMIGYYFGQLFSWAIPQQPIAGVDLMFLHWLIPLFIALGVWTVGNIGRERGTLLHCLSAAFLVYPMRYFLYDETYTLLGTALVATLIFEHYSKHWLRTPPIRRGKTCRFIKFSAAVCLYLSIFVCFLYFNGKITDEDGNEMSIHEALRNFYASTWWTDLKQALKDTYQYARHHGWYETWKEIFESMDVDGERNSYKVLGVSATASQAEITSAYRRLSKEYHPDKVKDENQRLEAHQKFIEIQQAYNVLSKIKSSRRRKNKQSIQDETIVM